MTIVFGDTSQGSPGMRLQTFCEQGFEFKVLADVCAVGHYVPLAETPHISIVPGQPHTWKAVLPTLRKPGEQFRLGIKCEDLWGNPTPLAQGQFRLEPTLVVNGLPDGFDFPLGEKSQLIDGLTVNQPGLLRIKLLDESNTVVAEAGPLLIRDGISGYWGDLHLSLIHI